MKRRVLETGSGQRLELQATWYGEKRWFDARYEPQFDAQGGVTGVLGYVRDITERKWHEEALWESEERFRSVLENSQDCIYRFNLQNGHYEYISPSAKKIVGFAEELRAQDIETAFAHIHPDDIAAMQAALAHLEESGEAEVEYRQRAKSGDYRWISNHMALTGSRRRAVSRRQHS